MEAELSDVEIAWFSEFVAERMGLHFSVPRWPDLRRGISAAARSLGFDNTAGFARQLISMGPTAEQLEALADHLTIGETYFFRERRSFEILVEEILPPIIRARRDGERHLRIWSAACCTGEEPYSIAIVLRRLIADIDSWNITILATDINPRFLRKACAGIYGRWSFRDAPAWLCAEYFRPMRDGQFEIDPAIRKMVRFAPLNLAEDTYPSVVNNTNAMDVIFCRNVLMYFTASRAEKVIHNLYRAQSDEGWLFVGANEILAYSSGPYTPARFPGVVVYSKGAGAKQSGVVNQPAFSTDPPAGPEISVVEMPPRTASTAPGAQIGFDIADRVDQSAEPRSDMRSQCVALYEQGRYSEAAARLKESIEGRPDDPAMLNLLTRCLANEGKLAEALGRCEEWVNADKLNPSAHYLRALLLQESGAIDGAVQSLRKALYLDSRFELAHFAMGNIARALGRIQEAERCFNNALKSLRARGRDEVLCESEGMTSGRLIEIIGELMQVEKAI